MTSNEAANRQTIASSDKRHCLHTPLQYRPLMLSNIKLFEVSISYNYRQTLIVIIDVFACIGLNLVVNDSWSILSNVGSTECFESAGRNGKPTNGYGKILIHEKAKVPAHHSAPASAALPEGSRADCIVVLVYKCLHGSAPAYLIDELCQVADVEARQRLRSSLSSSLIVSRTSTVGDLAFPVAAARVWNSLPELVTSAHSVALPVPAQNPPV